MARHPLLTTNEPARGGAHYDDPDLFDAYLTHRHAAVTSPNLVMEDPAFVDAAGSVADLDVLDLGCGDGTYAAACTAQGCASYAGVDGSALMIERANEQVPAGNVDFIHADLEDHVPPAASFDLVVSRMALHYPRDLGAVLSGAAQALRPGGRLVFTVVHPVITAAIETTEDGPRQQVTVDRYFETGDRHHTWFGRPVTWQHRTVEQYVRSVVDVGLQLDTISECAPVDHLFDGDTDEWERRRRVPLFLLVSAAAPAASSTCPS